MWSSSCRALRLRPEPHCGPDGGLHRCPVEELEAFLAQYDLGQAHVVQGHRRGRRELQLSSCRPSTGAYILTLYEKRVEADDLPFFLGLMEHLARAGLQLPDAGPRARTATLCRALLNGRPAAILTFLDGVSAAAAARSSSAAALGAALAELHAAGAGFTAAARPTISSLAGWQHLARDRLRAPRRSR